jgi:hypothetical protein
MIRVCALALVVSAPLGRAQQLYTGSAGVVAQEVDQMYLKGLKFLARTQAPAGNWPDQPRNTEPALTALAVISILAHGDDPNIGPYSKTVHQGLDFLLKNMDAKTGYIGPSMYNHGFSTLALAEAYGAVNDPRLGPALEKAVGLIVSAQAQNSRLAWRIAVPERVIQRPQFLPLVPDARRRHGLPNGVGSELDPHGYCVRGICPGQGEERA